jgi:hypothetical protein
MIIYCNYLRFFLIEDVIYEDFLSEDDNYWFIT